MIIRRMRAAGLYNTIDVGIASQFLGSQRNFVRVLGRNATYSRLPRKMVLARQTTFGVIKSFNLAGGIASTDAVPLPPLRDSLVAAI